MKNSGAGIFQIKSWAENTCHEAEGSARQSRAEIIQVYEGVMRGEASLQYLVVYRPDGTAVFTGMERFSGSSEDRTGSFVMIHGGKFEAGTATSNWCIVSGSATGALEGIEGSGSFSAEHGGTAEYTIEYALD